MTTLDLKHANPTQLAGLLRIPAGSDCDWQPEELAAIYRHQLSASIESDFTELSPDLARQLKRPASPDKAWPETFGELFQQPDPPDWLLELTKHFAKAHRNATDSPVPQEVATVLYFMSLAAAMVRCGRRLSKLDDSALQEGLAWCRSQCWVDDATRELLGKALEQTGQ